MTDPPRAVCLRPSTQTCSPQFLPVVQTANLSMREKKKKAKKDPYAWAQAQQRKNANIQRRGELKQQRESGWGDPINGVSTPFVESLDSAGQASRSNTLVDADGNVLKESQELPTAPGIRNFFLTDNELNEVTKHAYTLTKPVVGVVESQVNQLSEETLLQEHDERHAKAVEALRRITSMSNASGKDRYHANVRRIINEFGRHKTDKVLSPRPKSIHAPDTPVPPRAGPDTGSSEVQIAILTAKIRAVTKTLAGPGGNKDEHNKRALRLLVHRRQKLLKYMERRERGSERWTHMLEKLGLTPATWKGEITV